MSEKRRGYVVCFIHEGTDVCLRDATTDDEQEYIFTDYDEAHARAMSMIADSFGSRFFDFSGEE